PPLLGQFGGRPRDRALVVAQLRLEPLQQAEGVGRGAGEPGEHLAVVELADLLRVVLHDDVAERDLAVAADGGPGGSSHGENGCGAEAGHGKIPGGPANSQVRPATRTTGRRWAAKSRPATGHLNPAVPAGQVD